MFKKMLAGTAALVGVIGLGFTGTAHADTVLSNTGRTSNSFVSEPGAVCDTNAGKTSLTVKPPLVEGNPSYNSQYVGWRTVIYRWNGSTWGAPYKYGAVQNAITSPRSSARFSGPQSFTLPTGYYQATVQAFWYNPTSAAIEGQKWHRVDRVEIRSVFYGSSSYCTV